MGVNSYLPIHNRFYGFTSWSRTRTTPIDCPWIFMINQLGSDQCTWPWGHCVLSELREWRQQTGRHNGLKELTIGEAYLKINVIFLGFVNGILGVMDTCVRMWTRNYGPDGSGVFWRWTSVSRWTRNYGPDGSEEKREEVTGKERWRKREKRVRERERTERERRWKETERESGRESEARLDRRKRKREQEKEEKRAGKREELVVLRKRRGESQSFAR
ncbi:hypothetical protein TNCV_919451 [Trichonephila clavipes]|nr:hypothetical protein TNCV_919451 [Trichonephila clavipes]